MALVINDRVKETTTTTGTGDITFGGAVQGYETFAAAIGNSNTTYYAIYNPGTTEFEVGLGTLSGDSSTMARTTVISSSNSDSAVDFSAGTKDIFCTLPASKAPIYDSSGNLSLSGDLETNGNAISIPRSTGTGVNRISMGTSDEFQIYRTSSENTINTGNGDLRIRAASLTLKNNANNETIIEGTAHGSVDLYYDNSKKFETTTSGATVTGTLNADDIAIDTSVLVTDSTNNRVGINKASPDVNFDVEDDSADVASFRRSNNVGSGQIRLGNSDGYIRLGGANGDFSVYNSTNTSVRLYVASNTNVGVGTTTPASKLDVNGTVTADGVDLGDNEKIRLGASQDLEIYHDGGHSYIADVGNGALKIRGTNMQLENTDGSKRYANFTDGAQADLYYNNSKKFETTSTGVQTTGTISVNGAYTLPTSDGTSTQILQTDGAGALTFVDKPTAGASNGFVIAMAVAL